MIRATPTLLVALLLSSVATGLAAAGGGGTEAPPVQPAPDAAALPYPVTAPGPANGFPAEILDRMRAALAAQAGGNG